MLTIAVHDTTDQPPSLIGENGLADSQNNSVAGSAEVCGSRHVELRGPIRKPACVCACFVVVVFVLPFIILIFIKVGVFCSLSGVFFVLVVLLKSSCSISPLGYGLIVSE